MRGRTFENHTLSVQTLKAGEARERGRHVEEISKHCNVLGRSLQNLSGESRQDENRARRHLARIEHWPVRRIRPCVDEQEMDNGGEAAMTGLRQPLVESSLPKAPAHKIRNSHKEARTS